MSFLPGHIVVLDQFIDRTRNRDATFTGPGLVTHGLFADPDLRGPGKSSF